MKSTNDQVQIIKQKYLDIVKESAQRADKEGKLTKAQLNLIYEQQWFKMLAPISSGGLQLALPEALQIFETIANADGSTGWCVTHCALAGYSGGFLEGDFAKEIYSGEKTCVATCSSSTGIAEKTKTGYTISGTWQEVCGSADATAFILNCIVTQNGQPAKDAEDRLQELSFVVLKNEVTVLPTWNGMGLAAASCHAVEIKHLKVTAERCFVVSGASAKVNARLYSYPLLQFTEAALALNISGMASHFISICETLFAETKNRNGVLLADDSVVQDTFEKHLQKLNDARTKLYYATDLTWQACINNQQIKETMLYKVSSSAYDLAKRARECVDALYPFCGLQAMDQSSEINRVWRDLHTASHDSLLVFGGA